MITEDDLKKIRVFKTDAGLGYREYVIVIRMDISPNGWDYLIIDSHVNNSTEGYYEGDLLEDLADFYLTEIEYDIKKSSLYKTPLFLFLLNQYHIFFKDGLKDE